MDNAASSIAYLQSSHPRVTFDFELSSRHFQFRPASKLPIPRRPSSATSGFRGKASEDSRQTSGNRINCATLYSGAGNLCGLRELSWSSALKPLPKSKSPTLLLRPYPLYVELRVSANLLRCHKGKRYLDLEPFRCDQLGGPLTKLICDIMNSAEKTGFLSSAMFLFLP